MPRRYWSFLMPAEDHTSIKRLLAYYHIRLTLWGKIIVGIAFLSMAVASPGTHIGAYLLPSFIIAFLIVASLLSRLFIPRVSVRRILPPPPSVGAEYTYTVIVKNIGKKPIRNVAVYESTLPYGLYAALDHPNFKNTIDWLEPDQQQKVTLVVRTPRRGVFELLPLSIGSDFPSGITRKPIKAGGYDRLVVYPKFITQSRLALSPTQIFQVGGITESSKVGDSNEFLSTREFRYGDRLRDVHWPSTARANKLIVKEYIEEYIVRVGLIVDTHWPRNEKLKDFEARINLSAGIADGLMRRDYVIDLFTTDEKIPPASFGRGHNTLETCLETLSLIEGDYTVYFERLLQQLKPYMGGFSSLIVVLRDWDQTRLSFIEKLKSFGAPFRVFVVRSKTTTRPTDPSVSVLTAKETERLVI